MSKNAFASDSCRIWITEEVTVNEFALDLRSCGILRSVER